MSQKTYLQLVNKVLLNLRETQVTDLSAVYSQLIGEFVNQAKEKVEETARWKALDSTLTFTTVLSQTDYQLSAAATTPVVTSSTGLWPTQAAEVLKDDEGNWSVYDLTNVAVGGLLRLRREIAETVYAYNQFLVSQTPIQPNAFAYSWGANGVSNGATAFLRLLGPPMAARNLSVRMKCPQDEFSIGTEILLVPWRPVVSFATYLAMEERGEELGEQAPIYQARHEAELQRAQERDENGEEGYAQFKNLDAGYGNGSLVAGVF